MAKDPNKTQIRYDREPCGQVPEKSQKAKTSAGNVISSQSDKVLYFITSFM